MRRLKFAKFVVKKRYVSKNIEQLVDEKRAERRKELAEREKRDRKEQEKVMMEQKKIENMNDTLQFFQGSYRPLIR